jgi:hypothetical protein
MPPETTINHKLLEDEGCWYDDAFAPGQTPSFADFVRAHIDSTFSVVDDIIRDCPRDKVTQMILPNDFGLLFYSDRERIGRTARITCLISYLYDNRACKGTPKAGSFTFIMQVQSGKEKDIFRMLDKSKWSEISSGMFGLLQNYPATVCRLFANGTIGYTFSYLGSAESPNLRAKLAQTVNESVLPLLELSPYVMLYDAVAPGYHCPADFMQEDFLRLSATDRGTARAIMDARPADDAAFSSWLKRELQARPIPLTDVAMSILDPEAYRVAAGLFELSPDRQSFTPSFAEPRTTPLSLEDYLNGRYTPVAP